MTVAKKKSSRTAAKATTAPVNGKIRSFRELSAFGLWADRAEVKDPIQFTKKIRTRMEHGADAR